MTPRSFLSSSESRTARRSSAGPESWDRSVARGQYPKGSIPCARWLCAMRARKASTTGSCGAGCSRKRARKRNRSRERSMIVPPTWSPQRTSRNSCRIRWRQSSRCMKATPSTKPNSSSSSTSRQIAESASRDGFRSTIEAGFSVWIRALSNGSPKRLAMLCGGRTLLRSETSAHVTPGHAPGCIAAIAPKIPGCLNPRRRLPKPPNEPPVTMVVHRSPGRPAASVAETPQR